MSVRVRFPSGAQEEGDQNISRPLFLCTPFKYSISKGMFWLAIIHPHFIKETGSKVKLTLKIIARRQAQTTSAMHRHMPPESPQCIIAYKSITSYKSQNGVAIYGKSLSIKDLHLTAKEKRSSSCTTKLSPKARCGNFSPHRLQKCCAGCRYNPGHQESPAQIPDNAPYCGHIS